MAYSLPSGKRKATSVKVVPLMVMPITLPVKFVAVFNHSARASNWLVSPIFSPVAALATGSSSRVRV